MASQRIEQISLRRGACTTSLERFLPADCEFVGNLAKRPYIQGRGELRQPHKLVYIIPRDKNHSFGFMPVRIKGALEALRGDKTIQEIAAKHQVHPNQVSTWKRQAVEGMADVFARGGKPEGPTEAEIKELHAKIGRLAVENDFLSEGLKR